MLELDFKKETETVGVKDIYGEIINDEQYHKSGAIGSTMLSTMIENPIKYDMIKRGVMKFESQAFENGTILHTQVLEPHKCDNVYTVSDIKIPRKATKIMKDDLEYVGIPSEFLTAGGSISKKTIAEYEAWEQDQGENILVSSADIEVLDFLEDNKDKIIINSERDEKLKVAINNAEVYLPYFEKFFKSENGCSERSFFAILSTVGEDDIPLTFNEALELKDDDERLAYGVLCQCRPDRIFIADTDKPKELTILDFKTTGKTASTEDWVKSSASFGYDLQQVHYTRVLVANGFTVTDFIFAYCSLLEYGGAGYKAHQEADIENAKELHTEALKKLKWCEDNDTYNNQSFNGNGFNLVDTPALPMWRNYASV